MNNPLRSLRFRLVLVNLTVYGLIMAGSSVFTLFLCDRFLRRDIDHLLVGGTEVMADVIDDEPDFVVPESESPRVWPHANPFRSFEFYFQVCDAKGAVLEKSSNLKDVDLPLTPAARRAPLGGDGVIETLPPEVSTALQIAHPLRVSTVLRRRVAGGTFFLQVAVSLGAVEQTLSNVRRAAYAMIPIGLLIVAAASWWMVRRALGPIGRIAREAQTLTAARLDRRLPMPGGRDEVAELVETLNGMLARLEAAFIAQERFVANAAHELRTPITHLLGQAQVLSRQARRPEEYDRFISNVQDEMRFLGQVVESLLLLARADAGLPMAGRQLLSMNDVVVEAIRHCQPYATQREIRIEPSLAMASHEDAEPLVAGDHDLLVAMVSNLLRNAVRFSPPAQRVEIGVSLDAAVVQVSVRDHGPGVPPDQMAHLFDRFFQATRQPEGPKGSGLGLAIAQSVARLHGGEVRAVNLAGGGAEFTVRVARIGGE